MRFIPAELEEWAGKGRQIRIKEGHLCITVVLINVVHSEAIAIVLATLFGDLQRVLHLTAGAKRVFEGSRVVVVTLPLEHLELRQGGVHDAPFHVCWKSTVTFDVRPSVQAVPSSCNVEVVAFAHRVFQAAVLSPHVVASSTYQGWRTLPTIVVADPTSSVACLLGSEGNTIGVIVPAFASVRAPVTIDANKLVG